MHGTERTEEVESLAGGAFADVEPLEDVRETERLLRGIKESVYLADRGRNSKQLHRLAEELHALAGEFVGDPGAGDHLLDGFDRGAHGDDRNGDSREVQEQMNKWARSEHRFVEFGLDPVRGGTSPLASRSIQSSNARTVWQS